MPAVIIKEGLASAIAPQPRGVAIVAYPRNASKRPTPKLAHQTV